MIANYRLRTLDARNYVERVYAGILGKIIGVYPGRPIEGWTHQPICAGLGEIWYYVHDRLNVPLVVADDDLSGTFTFVRALADHGLQRSISAEQIGRTWLIYIIENKSALWWGGFGNSTEGFCRGISGACGFLAQSQGSRICRAISAMSSRSWTKSAGLVLGALLSVTFS